MKTKNRETDFIKIHLPSFIEMTEQLESQEAEIKRLREENAFLQKECHEDAESIRWLEDKNNSHRKTISKQTQRILGLEAELSRIKGMSMHEFGNTYCSAESLANDAHAFARSLGVGQ